MDIQTIQNYALAVGGTICLLIGFFSLLVDYQNKKRKISLIVMEFAAAILMFADIFIYVCDGNTELWSRIAMVVANFLAYALVYVELAGLNTYIGTYLPTKTQIYTFESKVVYGISAIGILMIVISLFNGMLYTINSSNHYQRGALFFMSYIMPLLLFVLIFSKTWQNRKEFSKHIFAANCIFVTLPLVTAAIQGLWYGLSLFNMAIGISMIIMFALSLINQNAYLSKLACTERVTGLPNGHGYVVEIEKKLAKGELVSYDALYFDIVRMGMINRKYGNPVGDYIIQAYAELLRESLEKDEVLGRLGGNYFVALVRKENIAPFLTLLSGVDIPIPRSQYHEVARVSSVAGIYEVSNEIKSADQVMANISMAVNVAKNIKKKPYVFLTPKLMQEMQEQRQLQQMIPVYMEKREFKVYYQPKVDLRTMRLCGAEALTRWEHDGEIIPPYRYIPLMEQNESICKFDFYMLTRVCEHISEWLSQGMTPPVISVNFSRRNLGNPILADEIYNVVRRHHVPPNLIQIEITETLDEYPLEYLKGVVEDLQSYGMTTAIDDFGTGSSSIKLLKDVPFDVLKIDKSFIDSISEKDRKILGYIIGMAHEMGAHVITEGVELKEQIEVLKELGCKEIQGYYFDKPLPKPVFEERLLNPVYAEKE